MLKRKLNQAIAQRQNAQHGLVLGQIIIIIGVSKVPVGDIDGTHSLRVRPHHRKFGTC